MDAWHPNLWRLQRRMCLINQSEDLWTEHGPDCLYQKKLYFRIFEETSTKVTKRDPIKIGNPPNKNDRPPLRASLPKSLLPHHQSPIQPPRKWTPHPLRNRPRNPKIRPNWLPGHLLEHENGHHFPIRTEKDRQSLNWTRIVFHKCYTKEHWN